MPGETRTLSLFARTDSRAMLGFDEAARRVKLYAEAGADMIFLEAPQTVEEIRAVPALSAKPALFNLVPRGKTPPIGAAELAGLGYGLVILPLITIGAAAGAMRAALARAAAGDTDTAGQDSPHELFEAVGIKSWDDIDKRYSRVR